MSSVSIRPPTVEDAAAIARVQVESWRTTYRGMVAGETLEKLSVEQRTERWRESLPRGGHVAFVAEEEPTRSPRS